MARRQLKGTDAFRQFTTQRVRRTPNSRWVLSSPAPLLFGLALAGALAGHWCAREERGRSSPHRTIYRTLDRIDHEEPWFEAYRVAPGVTAIYEPGHVEEVISYLVVGSSRAVLFDTGMGIGDMRALIERLTDRPVLVVNSHTHADHVGGNEQFSRVAVLDHPLAIERLTRGEPDLSHLLEPGTLRRPMPFDLDVARFRRPPRPPARLLEDGEVIDLGDRQLEVLATPGHSADSLCLLDRGNRLLFTGDTLYPGPLYAHTEDADVDAYGLTAEALAVLEPLVDLVLPGHNEPRMSAAALTELGAAFIAIRSGTAAGEPAPSASIRYRFTSFSVLVKGHR
jgi:glyoxylase-like metal-dependent hydrolase (beta-lactamase superfamily II)